MKIGIVTYHRAHNFGAILQAMATRITLEKMGHNAYFIDYWPEYHAKRYRFKSPSFLYATRHPYRYLRFLKTKNNILARIACFERFISSYIAPFCKSVLEYYDLVLYGSDQIWRKERLLDDFDSVYFGSDFIQSKIKVSFAASTYQLPNSHDSEKFRSLMKNFDAISVREVSLQMFCNKLGINAECLIDPTFLLNKEEWIKYLDIKKTNEKPYVLYYIMKQGVFDLSMIKKYCQQKGFKLKILHGYNIEKDDEENISIADPRDMVSLIYNAQFVITTSFHGLAFAINLHKEFVVSTDFGVDRIKSLLNEFNLVNRFVDGKENIPDFPAIDYSVVSTRHCCLRNYAINFLTKYTNSTN